MPPELDRICRLCGEPLPLWAMPLGACGDCLSARSRPAAGLPSPGYASLKRHEAPSHPFDIVIDDEEIPDA